VSIRVVELAGSPRERGRAHGETLRGEIRELHGAFVGLMAAPEEGAPPIPEAEMVAYARRHEPFVAVAAPDLLEEMRGIAEGAGLPFDAILVLTCVAEIRRLRVPAVRSALATRGCTLFAVQGGEVLIGQTYDIEPLWTPILFRIAGHGEEPDQLVVGHAGIMAEFGLNAAGIAFAGSAILVADQRPGVPAPVIARMILESRRLAQAAEAVTETARTVGIHYLIASPFGVIDLETSATRHAISYLQEPAFASANHIRSPALADLALGTWGASTYVRKGRMRRLLVEAGPSPTPEALQRCLADHADFPVGICNHVAPGLSACESRAAMVARPADATLWVADGPPCSHPFGEFKAVSAATQTGLRAVS
jgi:isopenicillin-N N-acyltransferase-like protein